MPSLQGPSPSRHCEHPKGAWQSRFWVPYSRSYESWVPEIATSGQKASLLAMTWGKDTPLVPEIASSEQKMLLLAMTLGEDRPSGNRHCEAPLFPVFVIANLRKEAWQSRENQPQYSPKASLRDSVLSLPRHCEPAQAGVAISLLGLTNTPHVPEIAASPKMRAPRNDTPSRHCEPAQAGVAISLLGLPTILSLRDLKRLTHSYSLVSLKMVLANSHFFVIIIKNGGRKWIFLIE